MTKIATDRDQEIDRDQATVHRPAKGPDLPTARTGVTVPVGSQDLPEIL